ncbi:MAG: FAD-dependent monooxygenase [Candidatus Omnitrophota bacterium]|nr:MAG: FAD-dependent monooxygenase [Candidatus Omnitrophota bacterium]
MKPAKDNCNVAIVGAGPAGIACGYALAKAGVDAVVFERGKYPGAKNMFGGIFFSNAMNRILPNFYDEAPIERFVAKRRYSMLVDNSEIAFGFEPEEFKKLPHNNSFIVKRSLFDKWFATKAEEQGAVVINNITIKDFLWDGDKVIGVISGPGSENTFLADVVVCAEGANSILSQKSGLRDKLGPTKRSIAVKEVIKLPRSVIEDRFGLSEKQGAAYEYFGSSVQGLLGNGFIYTNMDSLSVGIGFSLSDFMEKKGRESPNDILEDFKNHPSVEPLIKGGSTIEYMAHMIPSDSFSYLPNMYRDGLLLVGDAAGLLNTSFFHEGVNLAMASGLYAAETIIEARSKRDFTSKTLYQYQEKLNNSFVMQDLKNCKNFLSFLRSHKNLINGYPRLFNEILVDYFSVSEKSKREIKRGIFNKVRKNVKLTRMVTDMWGAWRSLI